MEHLQIAHTVKILYSSKPSFTANLSISKVIHKRERIYQNVLILSETCKNARSGDFNARLDTIKTLRKGIGFSRVGLYKIPVLVHCNFNCNYIVPFFKIIYCYKYSTYKKIILAIQIITFTLK